MYCAPRGDAPFSNYCIYMIFLLVLEVPLLRLVKIWEELTGSPHFWMGSFVALKSLLITEMLKGITCWFGHSVTRYGSLRLYIFTNSWLLPSESRMAKTNLLAESILACSLCLLGHWHLFQPRPVRPIPCWSCQHLVLTQPSWSFPIWPCIPQLSLWITDPLPGIAPRVCLHLLNLQLSLTNPL